LLESETVVAPPEGSLGDVVHTMCCRDQTILLCGLECTEVVIGDGCAECIACAREDDAGRCPRFRRCLDDELTRN
jgi:hypothetical protein